MATPCTPAVGSSTPLESPWLHWPEARGCVQVPYALLPIAGGAKHGHAPTYHPLRPGSGEAVPRARKSLGSSSSPHTPSGRAARAISAKG